MWKWRDSSGCELRIGDIVEDTERRIIGKIVLQNGLPALEIFKRFSAETLGYEFIDNKGTKEAYIRSIVPRHTRLWYWRRGYVLDNVTILRRMKSRHRRSNVRPV